jgi:hypothetical protein
VNFVELAQQLDLACTNVDCWDLECDGGCQDDEEQCQSCVDGSYCEHCRF